MVIINTMQQIKSKVSKMSISVRSSIAYIIVSLVTKGLAFITLPLFTRLMSTDEIGLVSIYYSWFSICSEILTLGTLSSGFNVGMSKFSGKRNAYSSSVLTFNLIVTIIASGVLFLFKNFFISVSSLPDALFYLMILGLIVTPATNIWLIQSRYEYRYKQVCVVSVIQASLATLVSLIAVLVASKNGVGSLGEIRLFSQNLIQYSFAIYFCFIIIKKGKVLYSKKYWSFSIVLGLPLVIHQIAGEILGTSDRIMIGRMVNNSAVGIYTTLYSLCTVGSIIWNGINSSLVPILYENLEKKEKRESLSRMISLALLVYGMFIILIVLCAPEIVLVMSTSEYLSRIALIPFFAINVFSTAISNIYSNVIVYYQKSKYIMISTLMAAVVNVVLNYLLISLWGSYGAAISTTISSIIMIAVQIFIAHKIYEHNVGMKLPFNERELHILFILMIIICILALVLYRVTALRYAVIAILFLAVLKFRKEISNILTTKM